MTFAMELLCLIGNKCSLYKHCKWAGAREARRLVKKGHCIPGTGHGCAQHRHTGALGSCQGQEGVSGGSAQCAASPHPTSAPRTRPSGCLAPPPPGASSSAAHPHTMRFGSTTKVLAKRMLTVLRNLILLQPSCRLIKMHACMGMHQTVMTSGRRPDCSPKGHTDDQRPEALRLWCNLHTRHSIPKSVRDIMFSMSF